MIEKQVERKFGRIESPPDYRDFHLTNFIPITLEPSPKSRVWEYPYSWESILDQKSSTHCVGFSMANFGINLPTFTPYTNQDGHDFYYQCKVIDGNPKSEEGSTIRSAAKVLRNVGAIEAYAFAYNLDQIKWWLLNKGPIIVGTVWNSNMMFPDENGVIGIGGSLMGGHAYLLNEWTEDDYIGFQNSWGGGWGVDGKGYIKATDFAKLFADRGEAMTAVELENYMVAQDPWFIKIIKSIIKAIILHFS